MKKIVAAALMLASMISVSGIAYAKDAVGSGPNPYSDCGIGAALFTKTPWAAVISNVIWDLGTTAVTSATASPQTCSAKKADAAMFIIRSYDSLAQETAVGKGEHISTLLNIYQCKADVQESMVKAIRKDFASYISSDVYDNRSTVDRSSAYYNIVLSVIQDNYASSCSV